MKPLQLVINGREYRSLDEVPEALRRLAALNLASMQLSAEQLRGERRIVLTISKKSIRRERRPEPEPEYEPASGALLGDDSADDRPSYMGPARQTSGGPLLGPGDPSPLSKTLLAVFLGFLAAVLFLKTCGR